MRPEITVGLRGSSAIEVTDRLATSFLGHEGARVLATPWLIAHLELTARNAVKPYLLDGEDTVGTQVNVRHLAATPMGMTARFEVEVTAIRGRRIEFRVAAWDDKDQIAEGTHERAVIHIAKFAERLSAKRSP